jgi:flagellar assembly protein FliH
MSELGLLLRRLRTRPEERGPTPERLRADAFSEGHRAGLEEGRAEGREQGWAEGRSEGERLGEESAMATLAPVRAALRAAAAALEEARALEPAMLHVPMLTLVRAVAERVLMAELGEGGARVLAPMVSAALAALETRPVALRARPETLAALAAELGETAFERIEDSDMPADMVLVEGGDVRVMAGLDARLDDVMAALS